jgi:putative membrane protein
MKTILTLAASFALAASIGCSQDRASNNNDQAAAPAGQVTTNQQSAALDPGDKTFMEKAAMGGKEEVELGQLAQEKAQNEQVKQFAQRMVSDHSQANSNLLDLASKLNVTLPTTMDDQQQKDKERLSKLNGAKFDKEYMKLMVDDHQKDVNEFQQQSQNAINSDVKSFASSTLPTLQQHLDLAKSVNESLNGKK